MKKKLLPLLLTLALLIGLLPSIGALQTVSAADTTAPSGGNYFNFPNEQYSASNARITTNQRVTLNGTINNVVGNSVSYSVYNITLNGSTEKVVNKIENQDDNITLNSNAITVTNLELFPGLNKITFKGTQGTSSVTESIYIEYRNSPMLYDLQATIRGSVYNILEDQTTVIQSALSQGKTKEDIAITGKAPNATKVAVTVNGRSYEYSVASSSDYSFTASPISVNAGKNVITIKVYNNSQVVETTREIAFYNGTVSFFDLQLTHDSDGVSVDNGGELSTTTNGSSLFLSGKAIIPIQNDGTKFKPDVTDMANIAAQFAYIPYGNTSVPFTAANITSIEPSVTDITTTTKFITVNFKLDLGASSGYSYDTAYKFQLQGYNVNEAQSQMSDSKTFYLRDNTKAYIYDVNYLSGYTSSMADNALQLEALEGTDIEGASIYSLPMGVEVLIGNYSSLGDYTNLIQMVNADGSANGNVTTKQAVHTQVVSRNVNGVQQSFLRVFLEISKLPTTGTQTLYFKLKNSTAVKSAQITLLYGPFVKYTDMYDGMSIDFDTTMAPDKGGITYMMGQLGNFAGQFQNVANPAELVYTNTGAPAKPQTVFFYVNNVEIPLKPDGTDNSKFSIDTTDANVLGTVFGLLNLTGENSFKIVFRTGKNNFESTVKVTIVPTNLPLIPAPNTDGIYPYSESRKAPLANDPNFKRQATIFTTKEASMNVYGTFDFIDLGSNYSTVSGRITDLGGSINNYILNVSSPDLVDTITWTLSNEFTLTSKGNPISGDNTVNKGLAVSGIEVFYDVDGQYFYFILKNQQLPKDGSSMVYNFTVFNSGEAGPRATNRLEVDPVAIPYTILSPVTEERKLNQNFVDVIISSPGADSILINGIEAQKVTYLDYSQDSVTPVPIEAYKVRVSNLKPNKVSPISLVITSATDKMTDQFNVDYEPANIPGAQFAQVMASSHKVFDGMLNLKFAKNSKLVRSDYNSTANNQTQVYSGNEILFGIANPTDGVLNRYEYRTQPADYWSENSIGKYYLDEFFTDRFIKASPLFWIDAGQADDDSTKAYDPITYGLNPYTYPVVQGDSDQQFFKRYDNGRELIPTAPGELTLSYDSSIAQSAGTVVTVFRYDPYNNIWENIGGVVDEKKHTIDVPFTKFGYYVVGKLTYGFNDINDHPYAREAMEAIYAKGLMNATDPTGIFGADQYVTRGEFARMIVRALDLPLNYEGTKHFIDVPVDSIINPNALYDYRYIETAARAGFVRGTRPETFEPKSNLTRQDAAVILAKALNLKLETDATKAKASLAKVFKDAGNANYYAVPSIVAIQKKGFIQGSLIDPSNPKGGSVFEPTAKLLRSDAAIIIGKVMADMKKLPKIYAN
ncbi:S-layer homology domain-containing protein [Paenibacillus protaetiae]|uniref:S-layer homology domain-containing protein n=1 Tax=Paenibacillus protaetiae TaxID=2509456 RepID=UPI0013EA54A2|nr:S-layer homology domain-containing protein [Paenibacillus protaetiae]